MGLALPQVADHDRSRNLSLIFFDVNLSLSKTKEINRNNLSNQDSYNRLEKDDCENDKFICEEFF